MTKQIAPAVGIELVLLKPPVDGGQGWEGGIGLLPLPVEEFDVEAGKGAHLVENALLLFKRQTSWFATVFAGFGTEGIEATLLKLIVPVFEGAFGDRDGRAVVQVER